MLVKVDRNNIPLYYTYENLLQFFFNIPVLKS